MKFSKLTKILLVAVGASTTNAYADVTPNKGEIAAKCQATYAVLAMAAQEQGNTKSYSVLMGAGVISNKIAYSNLSKQQADYITDNFGRKLLDLRARGNIQPIEEAFNFCNNWIKQNVQ